MIQEQTYQVTLQINVRSVSLNSCLRCQGACSMVLAHFDHFQYAMVGEGLEILPLAGVPNKWYFMWYQTHYPKGMGSLVQKAIMGCSLLEDSPMLIDGDVEAFKEPGLEDHYHYTSLYLATCEVPQCSYKCHSTNPTDASKLMQTANCCVCNWTRLWVGIRGVWYQDCTLCCLQYRQQSLYWTK